MSVFADDVRGLAQAGRARSLSANSNDDRFTKGSQPDSADDSFLRRHSTTPRDPRMLDLGDPQFGASGKVSSDRGMLDEFDQEFSQGPLDDENFEPEAGKRVQLANPSLPRPRRDSDYVHLVNRAHEVQAYREIPVAPARTPEQEEAHKLQLKDQTRYLHAGQQMSDEEGNAWDDNAGKRRNDRSRALKVSTPDAGWDRPKVGKFRSAMSWLGNKLTFGKWGGKDYRARQDALKGREALVKNAFDQQMTKTDEIQFDIGDEKAYQHERMKAKYGDKYIGRRPRLSPQREGETYADFTDRRDEALEDDIVNNDRYRVAPEWVRGSKFGRNAWDRLVSDSAGLGKQRMHIFGED